ncbi:MAG: OmpH family outer membrane protein [Cyclobacteriaceae bacterium]|jgi:outer membrane protein
MKNLSSILNVVLLVAVLVLYVLHFTGPQKPVASTSGVASDLKIAYINSDTVLKHYDYLKAAQGKFEEKGKKLEQEMKSRAQSLQSEIESYQRNVNSMTIGQAKAVEEDLGKKQQNFELYRERISQELMVEQDKINQELYTKITDFLKEYGAANGLHVVLKFSNTSDVLYGAEPLDISKQVIEGLNDAYRKESGKLKTPSEEKKEKK